MGGIGNEEEGMKRGSVVNHEMSSSEQLMWYAV
jgi:hypothetical protein